MTDIITPRTISGFPEHSPENRRIELELLDKIRQWYELAGFTNIETPAVERTEVLTSKGAEDKEIYTLSRLQAEQWEKDDKLALHFDLTVPMARYVAQRYNELTFPFRRYQIQKVWRWERPQGGRYREFYQADIDIVWDGNLPLSADVEVLTTIDNVLSWLNIWDYTIRLNNRKIIIGFIKSLGIQDERKVSQVTRIIDKMTKIWELEVRNLLWNLDIHEDVCNKIIEFCRITHTWNEWTLEYLKQLNSPDIENWVSELEEVYSQAKMLWMDMKKVAIDPSIARWLGYYTGTIYETFLSGHEGLWSICSGWRYDNLASYFTDKKLPWVGVSIWVSRLFTRLLEIEKLNTKIQSPSKVLVTRLQEKYLSEYLHILWELRKSWIPSELYLDGTVKIGKQIGYANRKWIPYAIVAGESEIEQNEVQLKHMYTGDKEQVSIKQISQRVKELLAQ